MTISEMIAELEKIKETVGDAEVAILNDGYIHSFQVSVVAGYDYGDKIRYFDDEDLDEEDEGDASVIVGISDC